MAQIIHNISTPNDGLGDELRTAFDHQNEMNTDLYTNKVDKVVGKDLSDNNFSDDDVTKLAGIEEGAEVNVQPDWLQDDDTQDDFIKNKPDQLFASFGYFHISDLATQTTPLSFDASTPLQLTNDGGGAFTNYEQSPYGVSDIWNTSTNQFDFTKLSVGDAVLVRTDLLISTTSINQNLRLYIKFGVGTALEYDLLIDSWNEKSIVTFEEFIKDVSFSIDNEDWRDAPAEIYILSDDDGEVKVNGWYTPIIRKSVNFIDFGTDTLKLDKVSTAGVERVYTINPDGSQATKPTSEIGTTQNYFTFSTNTSLTNAHHNAVIWVTATINITIPSGLRADFNCTFRTLTGAIATFLTSGTTINAESDGDVQDAKTMSYLAQYTTNNYIISGGGLS